MKASLRGFFVLYHYTMTPLRHCEPWLFWRSNLLKRVIYYGVAAVMLFTCND